MNTQPYICSIHIKNFRNFHEVAFRLTEKQIIIGENAVGKSNLLFALQLILDPTLSEKDRMLEESDFWEGLDSPMENGEIIQIELFFTNFEDNQNVLAQLTDATVMQDGKETLKLTYRFFKKDEKRSEYSFVIFKGNDETRTFTYDDRKILNIRVIKAIRDVESEMRNSRTSPLTQIIKQKYSISKDVLNEISKALDEKGADTLQIGQVTDLENRIHSLLNSMVSFGGDELGVSLKTMNIDATKLLYALRPLINDRETANTSLGINNILYIALILLLIEDDTIMTYMSSELYTELVALDKSGLIARCYTKIDANDEYSLNIAALADVELRDAVYEFLSNTVPSTHGVTILAVEEPEAHLHPIYQRLLYKHVMNKTNTSVIITTHSPHISAIAPITSLVHLIVNSEGTAVKTTASLSLSEADCADLSRYIDAKRGEIYTAKGIIFVEGISEEYLITSFAECLGYELDRLGVVVCNINSTNFTPYRRFAKALGIPCVIVTDGDYYHEVLKDGESIKRFGDISAEDDTGIGFDGIDRSIRMCEAYLQRKYEGDFCFMEYEEQIDAFSKINVFIGKHTFEVDVFLCSTEADIETICSLFDQLTAGGERQKTGFKANMVAGEYYKCLNQIESSYSGIGKGRFAQRLASNVTATMIPQYISDAINKIVRKVRS